MQSTLLMLLALFTAQVTDPTGDRYPDSQETVADTTEQESTPSATEEGTQEPAGSQPNIFDQIDAAEPLDNAGDTSSAAEPPAQDNTRSTYDLDTQPSFSAQPATPSETTTTPETETDPAKVLATLLDPPLESELKGTPLTLAQAIENSTSRVEQTQRVVAYWELSQAVSNYYLAYKERTELAALQQGITLPGADWELARQAATDRMQLALDRVRVAQQYLAQLMANNTIGFSPLPTDVPYCGRYETRYEQIFLGRPSPLAQQLNEFLGRAHDDLATRTHEIADARKWMFTASDKRTPQSDGNELLKAYELFSARRRLFLSAVKEYNLGIVRYTEIATPGNVDTERLVAMLIRTGSSPGTTLDRDVQRVNAEEGAGLNDSSSTQPAGGWNSATQSSAERSILVPRG
jgi:hypothetical protein